MAYFGSPADIDQERAEVPSRMWKKSWARRDSLPRLTRCGQRSAMQSRESPQDEGEAKSRAEKNPVMESTGFFGFGGGGGI